MWTNNKNNVSYEQYTREAIMERQRKENNYYIQAETDSSQTEVKAIFLIDADRSRHEVLTFGDMTCTTGIPLHSFTTSHY